MFQTLLESRAKLIDRGARWTVVSAGLHAAIICLAVVLTLRKAESEPAVKERIVEILFRSPPQHAPEAPAADARTRTSPRPFPTVEVPRVPGIPRIDASLDFDRNALSVDAIFREAPNLPVATVYAPGSVLTADRVDRQVLARPGNGQPSYPAALRAASVEGDVIARFVVDTLGQVESSSIAIIAATHALFAEEVRRWLARTRYVPAELDGRLVRQLVEQRIEFALRR